MKLTAQIRYPAPPTSVYAVLVDPAFQEQVCAATGALRYEVDVEEAGGGATVTTEREMASDDLPDFARKLVGQTLTVLRVDHWGPPRADGSREGTVVVEIQGVPVRVTGTLALTPEQAGTRQDIDADLKASVPLLGGRIEKAAEPAIRAAIRTEEELGLQRLCG